MTNWQLAGARLEGFYGRDGRCLRVAGSSGGTRRGGHTHAHMTPQGLLDEYRVRLDADSRKATLLRRTVYPRVNKTSKRTVSSAANRRG